MTRTGASSPLALARNTRTAPAKWTGTIISSCTASYAMPCIVRLSFVPCPSITLTGPSFPFASLANANILGTLTQFGTRIWPRLESYAIAPGLPKPTAGVPAGALRNTRLGATFPFAVRANTTAVCSL